MFTIENFISYEVVQKIGWVLLHFIWQAMAVALVLAFALRIMRRFSANLRYIVACLTLLIIVVLPFITMQFIEVSTPPAAVEMTPDTIKPVIKQNEVSFETTAAEPAKTVYVQPEPEVSEHRINWKEQVLTFLEPKLPHIVTIWLFGVFALSIWHLGGYTQLQKLRRKMVKQVDSSLNNKLKILAQKLGVKQVVQLLESALVQIPTVVGWLKPVILLPASALSGLSPEQFEAILAHELAHIKRYDYLINILQTIVEILGFYHPAVWWISHKIRIERENCCDDLAVAICGDRISYAKALTSMEEIRSRDQLVIAATGGNLFSRIRRLLTKDSSEKNALSWIPALTVIILLIALAIPTTIAFTSNRYGENSDIQAENTDLNTKVLIEAQVIQANNIFMNQVGLINDPNYLKYSNTLTLNQVDDSSNPFMFTLDSFNKKALLESIDKSENASYTSYLFMMSTSGKEVTIKSGTSYKLKSQELGRFIKVKPELAKDGTNVNVNCELTTRQFKNLDLYNKNIDQNNIPESEIVEYKVNTKNALLSDGQTLLIVGGKLVSLYEEEDGEPILSNIPFIGKFSNETAEGIVEDNEIILIKATIVPAELNDNSKFLSDNVFTSRAFRVDFNLNLLEPGQYFEIKNNGKREIIVKQVTCKGGKEFPCYDGNINFDIRSNFDLNFSTKLFTKGSILKRDSWDASFTDTNKIIGNSQFITKTLSISAWNANVYGPPINLDDNQASLVEVQIKPDKPENISGSQWGQDVNGLRASVEFIPDKESYSLGERIGIRFNIQNVSNKEIRIAYSELLDSYAEITNSRGEDVSIPSPYGVATGLSRTNRVNLKPNEIISLNNFGLGFGRQDDPALVKELTIDPNDYTTREYNKLEPDQYSIQYNILLPDVTIKSIYEQENVPRLDDWQGTLKSQIKKINITEKPTADPKRFELMLEKQSMRQAVQQLAQKYKARICFEEIENTAALNPNQYLLTGNFFAPTLSEFLNILTDNGLYDWDKINNTYVVYPKAGSILKYTVKQIFLSFSSLGDPLKKIISQAPEGMKFDFKIDPDISLPRYISYSLNIAEYDAMYALCRTLESTNKCIVWTLTHNNGNHLISLDYMPPTSLSTSDDKEILPPEKPNDIKNNTGNDTVLNAEEKIFRDLEHTETLLLKEFFNQVDNGIKSLKDNYPQLVSWEKEKIETAGLRSGKEIKNTRLTYYNASFPEKSPGSRDWCEKNGCYIFVKLSTGLESPYINTRSIRLTSRLSVLSTVITGQPINTELEKKINEVIDSVAASITQPEEENTTEQEKSAWQDYTAISNDLYKGAGREEIALRYLEVGNKYPYTKSGRISLELGKLLEQMAKEDKIFVQPQNIESLSDQQKINYYIFNLRDIAEREMFVPGKCFVLRDARTANSAAVALRKMGMAAIPSMISLLTDHRPTRSYGQELNGGVVLRYCDVALEILGDIAQPHETNSTAFFDPRPGRGTYLSNADEKTAAEIINKVTLWWQQNKSRIAAETKGEQTAQQTPWGQEVDGVQVRLKADKFAWKAGEIPKLKADVRNNGARELLIYRTQQLCKLNIDGQLYNIQEVSAFGSLFPPGKQYDGIEITLDRKWYKTGTDQPLQLSPDKHTIQVTFMLNDSRRGVIEPAPTPVIVKSIPVEIEILPDKKLSEYKKTLPSGITVELLGMCEYPSMGKKWYKPDGKLLENPPYDGSILSILSSNMIDSVPVEFAFRLTGDFNEPAWEAQVKTDNNDFVWWTGRRSINREFVRDIKSIGMYVKLNQESINLRLGFSIDGKPQEWAEFNNISVKNIVQENDNVQSQIKRIKSAQNMKQLALTVFMYAQEHDDKLPEKLDTLKPYFKDENVFLWNLENVKYIGEGTLSRANSANIPIAFDYKLQDSNSTNFLFLDGHVAFQPIEKYQDFLVSKKQVLIKMTYLEVAENFLEKTNFKEAGINVNSNIGTMAIFDDSQQALFLKAVKADAKSRIINIPSLTVLNEKTARPVLEQIPDVTTFDITPLVMSEQTIVLTIGLRIGEMAGHGAGVSNEEVSLKVWKIQFASTEYVSNGKTWVVNVGEIIPDDNKSGRSEEKKRIIVFVQPTIIQPEQQKTKDSTHNDNSTDMIGAPANEFIINTSEKTQPVKEQQKPEKATDSNMVQRTYDIGDLVYYSARKNSDANNTKYSDNMPPGMGGMMGGGMMGGMGSYNSSYGGMPNERLAKAAKELVNLIMELIQPDSWYEINVNGKGTIYVYPAEQPKKMTVTNTIEVHKMIEKFLESLRKELGKQVSLEIRYIYGSEQAISEILNITGIEKINTTILDDTQVTKLVKATQGNQNIKTLVTPRVTVLNGEMTQFGSIGAESTLDMSCRITPIITHDHNNVIIDFTNRMKSEQSANADEISLTDITIPNKQTFVFSKVVNNQPASSGDKQLLIVLIRPTIILQEEAEALPGEGGMGGSIIINSEAAPRRISGQSLNSQSQENTGKVLIETQYLQVSNEFLKLVGLDANSLKTSDTWSKYHVKDSNDVNIFIIDQLSADLFQKTIDSRKDVKVIAKPTVIAAAGKDGIIKVLKEDYYLIGSGTKSDFATEDSFDKDKKEKIETLKNNRELIKLTSGTSFNMKPEILSDNNIQLELKINIGDIITPEEELIINNVTVSDGTPAKNSKYSLPKEVTLINKSVNTLIPNGQTLLIIGNKISIGIEHESKTPILGDLPILNRVFTNRSYIKYEYIQLFLIKPTIISDKN
jgi:prepilin-type processing-associated H-X9-DG protein